MVNGAQEERGSSEDRKNGRSDDGVVRAERAHRAFTATSTRWVWGEVRSIPDTAVDERNEANHIPTRGYERMMCADGVW